ncbi:Scr1 family TA system antitoxin-like transcriptional regulator [Actinokineospora bangkokensis]|uniref:HTH cro/C1-type domain-containing protein n=1 Tax=Actinokineospora bangkokensis TaxID=1193682 RepID=A0A1Q9LR06_9PSEU|nr:Scr1 family TA system antitoxin-like transcriptional regulator [Actinokineospora bangkokensis]OLR94487.1 hypothetical protein BJP25_12125 [Actinokineospora bangkokensis]
MPSSKPRTTPTLLNAYIGARLHHELTHHGYTQTQLAKATGFSPATVSRTLTGTRNIDTTDIAIIIATTALPTSLRHELTTLLTTNPPQRLTLTHHPTHPDPLHLLRNHITATTTYSPDVLPPHLRTPDYHHALRHALPTHLHSDAHAPQKSLARTKPTTARLPQPRFLITRQALHPPGTPEPVARAQMRHLDDIIGHGHADIRLVDGPPATNRFTLLRLDRDNHLVLTEHLTHHVLDAHPTTITTHQLLLDHLNHHALDPNATRTALHHHVTGTTPPDPHSRATP